MTIIILALVAIVLFIVYFIILMPFVPLLKLKLQLGDKAILMFKPISGLFGIFTDSNTKYQDVMTSIHQAMLKNPKAIVVLTNFFHKPFLWFTGPEYIRELFLDPHGYIKQDPTNYIFQKGLVTTEGDVWKRQRKLLSNSFTFEKLTTRLPMINQVVKNISAKDPKTNLTSFLSKITGEVIIQSFFGELANGLQLEGKDAQVALIELSTGLAQAPLLNPYILMKQIIFEYKSWKIFPTKIEKELLGKCENLKNVVKSLIEKRINQLKGQTILKSDDVILLDLYVTEYLKNQSQDHQTSLDLDEVIHQFLTLFVAGTDTTATTSATALYYLAQYPEMQKEILQEIKDVVGDSEVKEEHVNKLVRINGLIQEVLRVKNPANFPLFRTTRNDKQLLEVKLKKGWFVVPYHSAGSIREQHFENPSQFDYKRWVGQKNVVKNDNGFIHIPFGAGPRNCIGQHMALMVAKIVLTHIIRQFDIQMNPNTKQINFGLRLLYCVEPDDCLVFKKRV